jgi:hypothetical protein
VRGRAGAPCAGRAERPSARARLGAGWTALFGCNLDDGLIGAKCAGGAFRLRSQQKPRFLLAVDPDVREKRRRRLFANRTLTVGRVTALVLTPPQRNN